MDYPMTMTPTYHVKDAYLFVQISGIWTAAAARELIQEILVTAQNVHRTSVFLDIRELLPPMDNYVRYLTGVDIAEIWDSKLKVVALAKSQYLSGFAEKVAVNGGANFAVFSDFYRAEIWLDEVDH